MDLNIPETRQEILETRLADGAQIVAADVAAEFGISVDTVRRDIIALEASGKAHRVRGGAVPVVRPSAPLHRRLSEPSVENSALAEAALARLDGCATLLLDGGSTVLALANRLRPTNDLVVMTPSPWVAVACQRNGIGVFMIGGRLSTRGGVNVGEDAGLRLAGVAADIAVLGACGLDADFGLSSDDFEEAKLKQSMAAAARRTLVLTDASKLGRRARHRTLLPREIDLIVTDGGTADTIAFQTAGVETHCV